MPCAQSYAYPKGLYINTADLCTLTMETSGLLGNHAWAVSGNVTCLNMLVCSPLRRHGAQ